ncbi:SDR family NAD(P)-dependent oxidoreductase [Zhongshania sp.]|uniref:SDR family NAD(P)-dependent oxidoreductase n=1 Tax=Zhongshania sp. TaxID=1971902 RepID=UPI0035673CAB
MSVFKGKVAVITGAGSGIGRCLAIQLAEAGARLAISDINAAGLDATLKALPTSTDARSYIVDASSQESVFAHAKEVGNDFGGADYVFNNAGATVVGTFENLDVDEIEWQLNINLWGVIYGCKAFLPIMREQGSGCLVNISSVFGLVGFPAQSAYNMSKFAVRGLTECLWQELAGSGIQAITVHPGGIKTNIEKGSRRCRNAGPTEDKFQRQADDMLVTTPERCARDILKGVARGRRRILTGKYSRTLYYLARLFPNSYFRFIALIAR